MGRQVMTGQTKWNSYDTDGSPSQDQPNDFSFYSWKQTKICVSRTDAASSHDRPNYFLLHENKNKFPWYWWGIKSQPSTHIFLVILMGHQVTIVQAKKLLILIKRQVTIVQAKKSCDTDARGVKSWPSTDTFLLILMGHQTTLV